MELLPCIRQYSVVTRSVASACVPVDPVPVLTFESLHLQTLLTVRRYIFRIPRSSSYTMVIGGQGHRNKTVSVCPVEALTLQYLDIQTSFSVRAGGLSSTER